MAEIISAVKKRKVSLHGLGGNWSYACAKVFLCATGVLWICHQKNPMNHKGGKLYDSSNGGIGRYATTIQSSGVSVVVAAGDGGVVESFQKEDKVLRRWTRQTNKNRQIW